MRVLIVDDHPVVRRGVKHLLARNTPDLVTGEAESGDEALEKARAADWDLILLDLSMPGRSGLEVLRDLRRERPAAPVLILSMFPEDRFGPMILKAGAAGYVTKDSAPDELLSAVRQVSAGGTYFRSFDAAGGAAAAWPDRPPHQRLSSREYQVFSALASGKRVTDVAAELQLSVKTVSTYRERIMLKMELKTNAELMRYAVKHELV